MITKPTETNLGCSDGPHVQEVVEPVVKLSLLRWARHTRLQGEKSIDECVLLCHTALALRDEICLTSSDEGPGEKVPGPLIQLTGRGRLKLSMALKICAMSTEFDP
jgi:hypothetical protein